MTPTSFDAAVSGLDELSRLRRAMSYRLRELDLEQQIIDDIVLIVSELVTNAFTHGRADDADLRVTLDDGEVELAVSHRHAGPTDIPTAPSAMPDGDMPSGRGLAVVDALTTQRETNVSAERVEIRCRVARGRHARPG